VEWPAPETVKHLRSFLGMGVPGVIRSHQAIAYVSTSPVSFRSCSQDGRAH